MVVWLIFHILRFIIFAYFTFWCMNNPTPNTATSPSTSTDSSDIRPRSQWDEDEIFDGRPKAATISVLVVPPFGAPYAHELDNNLDPMQALIGGTVTSFETDVFDTVGIAHDEGLLLRLPPNRLIPATGAVIFGTFFVAGSGVNLHSLTDEQMAEAARVFERPITLQQLACLLQQERAEFVD